MRRRQELSPGRQSERGALDRLPAAARYGHGGAIVVLGEPGIGKTALIEQAVASAQDSLVLLLRAKRGRWSSLSRHCSNFAHRNSTVNASLDKLLSRDGLRGFGNSMLDGTGIAVTDPRINLAYADPTGLPPTMIFYGEYELLVDDANQFAERARAVGVDLELRSLPEGQHNFFRGPARFPRSTRRSLRWARGCAPRSRRAVAPA